MPCSGAWQIIIYGIKVCQAKEKSATYKILNITELKDALHCDTLLIREGISADVIFPISNLKSDEPNYDK